MAMQWKKISCHKNSHSYSFFWFLLFSVYFSSYARTKGKHFSRRLVRFIDNQNIYLGYAWSRTPLWKLTNWINGIFFPQLKGGLLAYWRRTELSHKLIATIRFAISLLKCWKVRAIAYLFGATDFWRKYGLLWYAKWPLSAGKIWLKINIALNIADRVFRYLIYHWVWTKRLSRVFWFMSSCHVSYSI